MARSKFDAGGALTNVLRVVEPTPFGKSLALDFAAERITASSWVEPQCGSSADVPSALVREALRQVQAYLRKQLRVFDLPLSLTGSPFELAVWNAVVSIPFGMRVSYGDVARAVDSPAAHRGVARAMANTPFALLIPAHRVVGADGKVKGAQSGSMRTQLLAFETCDPRSHLRS